ncbi:MAG: hypothetical protein K8I02_03600 [Candidatus Methylomirabilis sp.]|nr:hypothetical protein [Deltaproteobacteria bacterium]
MFGQYLLKKNLISEEDVSGARRLQLRSNQALGVIARQRGMLTPHQIREVREVQKRWGLKFGAVAVRLGFLSAPDLRELLLIQRHSHLYFGACLVAIGAIDDITMQRELDRYRAERKPGEAEDEEERWAV